MAYQSNGLDCMGACHVDFVRAATPSPCECVHNYGPFYVCTPNPDPAYVLCKYIASPHDPCKDAWTRDRCADIYP